MQFDIVIIGGGAAGLYLANALVQPSKFGFSSTAQNLPRVLLMEAQDQLGKKILATGNGRCNLGNLDMSPRHFHAGEKGLVADILHFWPVERAIRVWQKLGLPLLTEQGRLYPLSQRASSVRFALTRHLIHAPNLDIRLSAKAETIRYDSSQNCYQISIENGASVQAHQVVLATGGLVQPSSADLGEQSLCLAKSCHLELTSTFTPSLVALQVKQMSKRLAGIRVKAESSLYHLSGYKLHNLPLQKLASLCYQQSVKAKERGEIQLTDYGLSGIPIMSIARFFKAQETVVCLDFFPDYDLNSWLELAVEDLASTNLKMEEWGQNFFHEQLAKYLVQAFFGKAALEKYCSDFNLNQWQDFFRLLKNWPFVIDSPKEWKHAQVMCGGCLLSSFTAHLEVRKQPGLFVVGELLDVDGICGGYNLHWAWSTAAIVADHLLQIWTTKHES